MWDVINSVIEEVGSGAEMIINQLPQSPFKAYTAISIDAQYFRWLNWLVPVGQMIVILQAWLAAIVLWYGISIILRWIKAVS